MSGGVDAVTYHERTKHSPASVRSGPGLDFDNKPAPYKTYVDLPKLDLPDDPPGPGLPALEAIGIDRSRPPPRPPSGRDAATIDRRSVAQLCHFAAGITKELRLRDRTVPFRAAACTGALYHVDLYPVCGGLDDLEAGVYHYDPRTESLDVVRRGDHRGVLAAASDHDGVAEAPLTVVATSTWWRNAWKYRERTFRHAFWDSGTVIANLLAVAHALGLRASAVLGFADRPVADLLGVDPAEEGPLELVPIGAGSPTPEPGPAEPIHPETEPLSPSPIDYPLIRRAFDAGTLEDGPAAADWRDLARSTAPFGPRTRGEGEFIALDPADRESAPNRPLGRTIVRRGSSRRYERYPIGFRTLSTVLDRAVRGAPLDVRPPDGSAGRHGPSAPSLAFTDPFLVVNAVEGLPAGSYRYDPDADDLERLERGSFRREAGHLALDQRLGADAAVCVYFLADIEGITGALGDRGYRAAQFEAAVTAGRLYLGTYAHPNLGGTGLTFYDDLVTEFFEPRAAGRTPMFLFTIGRPAPS